jgi:hypothetical protein
MKKLEQRETENLVIMLLGCKLPLTHEALKAAYRNAVRLNKQGAQPMSIVRQWDLIQRGRGNASAQ